MQKNIMTTVEERLHAALMKQANDEGVSLREYLRKVLQNDIKQHYIAQQVDRVLFDDDAQLNDPLFAMNISPETAYQRLIASGQYKRTEIDQIVANLLIKQQQLIMQRIATVGQQIDPEIDDVHESLLNKFQTKVKFSPRPWVPVEVLYDQHGNGVLVKEFAKEVLFDEPDENIHDTLIDALATIRLYYGIEQINHSQIGAVLTMVDDNDKYRKDETVRNDERPCVNLLDPFNFKAWRKMQQTVSNSIEKQER